jgi:hypothetical protein
LTTRQQLTARPRAELERNRATRVDGDDLLLLATDRAQRLMPQESIDRFHPENNEHRNGGAQYRLLFDEPLAVVFSAWE